jgi:uncharacterized RmlC-like cupin family protein
MTGTTRDWRDGVRVVRASALAASLNGPFGSGRATALEFAGVAGSRTWVGLVTMPPGGDTGPHSHGRHEVAIYTIRGAGRILWGERLEFAADVQPGDFVYFAPFAPHAEFNLDPAATLDFLVVRSDGERIVLPLETQPVAQPEFIP